MARARTSSSPPVFDLASFAGCFRTASSGSGRGPPCTPRSGMGTPGSPESTTGARTSSACGSRPVPLGRSRGCRTAQVSCTRTRLRPERRPRSPRPGLARPVSCSSPFAVIAEPPEPSSFEVCTSAPPRAGRMTIASHSSRMTPSGSTTHGSGACGSSAAGRPARQPATASAAVGVGYAGRLRELTLASGKLRFAPRLPSPAVGLVTAVG